MRLVLVVPHAQFKFVHGLIDVLHGRDAMAAKVVIGMFEIFMSLV